AAQFAQVVEVDAPAALALRDAGREGLRRVAGKCLGDRAREREAVVPAGSALDRNHQMETLTSRRLEKALEPHVLQICPQSASSRNDVAPGHVVAGIQIEHQPVWLLEVLADPAPRVD